MRLQPIEAIASRYMATNNSQGQGQGEVVGRALDALKREYVLVGKTHVRAWDAWVVLGAFVGVVFATVLIANRSGEVGSSNAAVPPPPPVQVLTVVFPNGGETWAPGSKQEIRWVGGSKSDRIRIWLDGTPMPPTTTPPPPPPPPPSPGDAAKPVPGPRSTLIANGLPNTGSYFWTIPASTKTGPYLIRICTTKNAASVCTMTDTSNGSFMITPVPPTNISPKIVSVSPYPTSISPGQLVPFSLSATDADNDDLSWSVDWGDGTMYTQTCQIPNPQKGQNWTYNDSHAWASVGDYVAKFTVGDCRGGSDWYSYSIHVAVPEGKLSVRANAIQGEVIPGSSKVLLGSFDVIASGEDALVSELGIRLGVSWCCAEVSDLTNLQILDANGNIVEGPKNPVGSEFANLTFTDTVVFRQGTYRYYLYGNVGVKFANGQVITVGTIPAEQWIAAGVVTGVKITPSPDTFITIGSTAVKSGSLSVALDSSSPPLRLAQAGQETAVATLRLSAAREDIALSQIALKLGGSAVPSDVVTYSLWDGATKVGETIATSSASGIIIQTSGLIIPRDGDKIVTVKAQLSAIGVGQPGHAGVNVAVDWDQVNVNGVSATYGLGQQSSSYIYAEGSDTQSAGVIVYRANPIIATLPIPSNSLADATQKTLYRFSISAPAGTNGVSLYKFVFNIATTSDEGTTNDFFISNLHQYAYTNSSFSGDAYASNPINSGGLSRAIPDGPGGWCGVGPPGLTCSLDYAFYFNPVNPTSSVPEAINVPAGMTYYFEFKGDVTGADSGDSAAIQLLGDATFNKLNTPQTVDLAAENDFVWSGNSTTTHSGVAGASGADWTNGYLVPGLPSQGAVINVLSL